MSAVSIIILVAILVIGLGVIGFVLLQDAFVKIRPGEVGLVIRRGQPSKRGLNPGSHFALRFSREIEVYPSVELTYLSVPDAALARTPEDALTFVDPPVQTGLGDMDTALVHYTVRFKITLDGLPNIHLRFGRSGMKGIVRDESRRVIIAVLGSADVSSGTLLGPGRAAIEERITTELAAALSACGFELTMFNLREIDLAETGDLIQSTLRTAEELERERARGAVRMLRAQQEAEMHSLLAGNLSPQAIEYLRVEAMRELIDRWDGKLLSVAGLPMFEGRVAEGAIPGDAATGTQAPPSGRQTPAPAPAAEPTQGGR